MSLGVAAPKDTVRPFHGRGSTSTDKTKWTCSMRIIRSIAAVMGRFGGGVYTGAPALPLTLSMSVAGGGPKA